LASTSGVGAPRASITTSHAAGEREEKKENHAKSRYETRQNHKRKRGPDREKGNFHTNSHAVLSTFHIQQIYRAARRGDKLQAFNEINLDNPIF
jgi:hypothetical protein